jgi:hypothetical protein
MNPHYAQAALRAGHRCEYCRAPEVVFNFPFEVEHVIPFSRGGEDADANRALACRSCNLRKAAHVSAMDPVSRGEVHLFHPRQDRWAEHFGINAERGAIEGLTAVGRASVARLEMNSEAQAAARRQWMRLGLFP